MKKAFSLIELSIVILITALLMIGIFQGGLMIKKSRLASAQTLTQNSVVNHFDNLLAWFETSLENSFIAREISDDGNNISIWHDNNPKAVNRNNATQALAASQPKFYENIFNNAIPGIRFDGIDDFMNFDGTGIANNSYTIFVVEQRRSGASNNFFLGGSDLSANTNLSLGYLNNTTLTQDHYTNGLNGTFTAYSQPTARIHCFSFDSTNGKNYWLNGALISSESSQTNALTSYVGAALGRYISNYYIGDMAELIIVKSKLKTEEKRAVEDYLGKKYNIIIS